MVDHVEMALADIIKAKKKVPRKNDVGRKFSTTRKAEGTPRGGGVDLIRNNRTYGVIRGRNRRAITNSTYYTRVSIYFNNYSKYQILVLKDRQSVFLIIR